MLSKLYWNSKWIVSLLSILDLLIILCLNPAKTWADIPQSSSSTVSDSISAPISKQDKAAISQISQALSPDREQSPISKSAEFTQEEEINSVSDLLSGKRPPTSKPTDSTQEEQVNSVSQLSDVQPSDWAFQALQSLVERYGVISGYPDQSFKGNRSLTRYEFAAALSAAQDRLRELVANSTNDIVRKEDWETLEKLQSQFSPELAQLRGRVDVLEAKTAVLQAQQFSPTSVLTGRAQIVVGSLLSGNNVITKQRVPRVVTLQDNLSFRLNTSFTGKDVLTVTAGGGSVASLGQTRAGLLGTYEGRTADNANITRPFNDFSLTGLRYRFLLTPNTQFNIYAQNDGANELGFSVPINPYFESSFASGANGITRFSRRALVYNYGDNGPGVAILQKFGKQLQIGVAYSAPNGANPSPNNGLFSGRYLALAQILYNNPKNNFRISAAYVNTYSPPNTTGFSGTNFGPAVGSNLVNSTVPGTGTIGNLYGVQAFYQVSPKFAINGWVSYASHRYIGRGDAQAMDWAVGLSFPDLFSQGSLGGFLVGMEPRLMSLSNNVDLGAGRGRADKDLSLHIEAFYQYKLSDNIDITPGLVWITAPDSDSSNPGSLYAWIRTLFKF